MVRTRFAPSPTGFLHIGGLRTAAYAYALAKHSGGEFLLRIEDTDQKREVKGAVTELKKTLLRFNLQWDAEHIQSQRLDLYKQAAEKLVNTGHAYRDDGAVRLKIPKDEKIAFHDFVLNKEVSWNSNDMPEAVLLKSDGFPTYHLAVVVDDHDTGISHVIRAVEWLPSTPIHLLVYKYLGFNAPEFGHPTDILDPAGGKLSKRKNNVSVEQFLADGYLPEALLNFVILLGWAPKDNRELFTLDEFVAAFDIKGFQKSNPALNLAKLDWFNSHYIRQKSDSELLQLIKPYFNHPKLAEIIPLIKDRIVKLSDVQSLTSFFVSAPSVTPDPSLSPDHLRFALDHFDQLGKPEFLEQIKSRGWKVGDFFMSLRIAVCGSRSTPPITETMLVLGKEESVSRIKATLHEH